MKTKAKQYLQTLTKETVLPYEYDPKYLPDIAILLPQIEKCKETNTHIFIYGDFDADGICATTIMTLGLQYFLEDTGIEVFYKTPERDQGHGLRESILDEALEKNCSLVISVDTGSNDKEIIDIYKEKGLFFIITDHHPIQIQESELTYPLINPLRGYKDPYLCGSGVAYKIIRYLEEAYKKDISEKLLKKIQVLTLIATVADMVPLRNENLFFIIEFRDLFFEDISQYSRVLSEIIKQYNIEPSQGKFIGFWLAPLLNWAWRLNKSNYVIDLLIKEEKYWPEYIELGVKYLGELNTYRKELVDQWKQYIEYKGLRKVYKNISVAVGLNIPSGIKRLIAHQYLEDPITISFCGSLSAYGYVSASVINKSKVDIISFLQEKDYISNIWGHKAAFWFSYKKAKEQKLLEDISYFIESQDIKQGEEEKELIKLEGKRLEELRELALLHKYCIWGTELEEPLFYSHIEIERQSLLKEKHLKIEARTELGEKVVILSWNRIQKFEQKEISIEHTIDINSYDNTIQYFLPS